MRSLDTAHVESLQWAQSAVMTHLAVAWTDGTHVDSYRALSHSSHFLVQVLIVLSRSVHTVLSDPFSRDLPPSLSATIVTMTSTSTASLLVALALSVLLLTLIPSPSNASATFPSFSSYAGKPYNVSYDSRSLRLNNQPVVFLSGSIHYPRSTPAMWPGLMKAAAADGVNMIEIYVFWNFHEPVEGQFVWSDRGNLTLFLDAIAEAGLFANLRIGPYVCAEWDYGGIPTWLAYVPGIRFRSYNEQWRMAVQKFVGEVIAQTRTYFADHGGPIVLAQIENELNGGDPRYVQWNGDMANGFNVNVPWLMCNGQSANNTINTCNGNDCTSFINSNGQNGRVMKDQPAMWTENEGPPSQHFPPSQSQYHPRCVASHFSSFALCHSSPILLFLHRLVSELD